MAVVLMTIIVFMVVAMPVSAIAADEGPTVYVNGEALAVSAKLVPPGRTMVPLRVYFEALGFEVDYDAATHTAIAGARPANLPLRGEYINIVVEGEIVVSGVPPFVEEGTTYVPVRFVSENAGLEVQWNDERREVYIVTPPTFEDENGETGIGTYLARIRDTELTGCQVRLTLPMVLYDASKSTEYDRLTKGTVLPEVDMSERETVSSIAVLYDGYIFLLENRGYEILP